MKCKHALVGLSARVPVHKERLPDLQLCQLSLSEGPILKCLNIHYREERALATEICKYASTAGLLQTG